MTGFPAWRLARHEWRLILKEPRFLLTFLVTPLLIVGLQGFALYFRGFANDGESLALAQSLILMLAVLAPSMAVPLGADSFAGEKERNTLEILLCLPVGPGSLFWGKVFGILPLPVLVGWLGQGLLLSMVAGSLPVPAEFWMLAAKAMALTPAVALFFCSLSAFLSMGSETVRGAAQLSSFGMLGIFLVVLPLAGMIHRSTPVYAALMGGLLLGAGICLALARRRFLALP